jgi:hypothetical protein
MFIFSRCASIPSEQQRVVVPVPIRTWIIAVGWVKNLMTNNGGVVPIIGVNSARGYTTVTATGESGAGTEAWPCPGLCSILKYMLILPLRACKFAPRPRERLSFDR